MFNKLFSKKVSVFGKAIPLTLIIALVLATTAFAAWLLLSQMTATFSTVSIGPVVADSEGAATVSTDAGIPGVTCSISATVGQPDFSVGMANADPGDKCGYDLLVNNQGDHDLYVGPLSNDPTHGGAFIVTEDFACGQLIPQNSVAPLTWYFELSVDSDPSTTYGPSVFDIEYTIAAPTCP